MGGLWHGATCAKNVENISHRKSVDQVDAEKELQEGIQGDWPKGVAIKRGAGACWAQQRPAFWRFTDASGILTQEDQVIGTATWKNSEKTTSSVYGQV